MPTMFTSSGGQDYMAEQGADARLDYGLDWSDFLAGGDTIASSNWTSNHPLLVVSGADVAASVTTVFLSGGIPGRWYAVDNTIVTAAGRRETRSCRLFVRETADHVGSALFPDRVSTLSTVRRDYLPALMAGHGSVSVSDGFLWARLMWAEAHIAHVFRAPMRPTTFFPVQPTPEQVAALDGEPWDVDPPYELDPHDVQYGGTRTLKLRQVPVIAVQRVDMVYPGQQAPGYSFPLEWLRLDAKYGQLQIVPIGSQFGVAVPSAGLALAAMAGGAVIPQVFHVTYRAGLQNLSTNYPDLVDIALRLMCIGVLRTRVPPQSGSINADGLSQSVSAPDFGAMIGQVDDELDEIRQTIVGQRFGVL